MGFPPPPAPSPPAGAGIYDSSYFADNSSDEDLVIEVDLAELADGPLAISGNFAVQGGTEGFDNPYAFTTVSDSIGGGFIFSGTQGLDGRWTYLITGTPVLGAEMVFTVSATVAFPGMDPDSVKDTDTVTIRIVCFAEGTRIMTEAGERRVEDLQVGDMVPTRDAGLQPIRWIGHQAVAAKGAFAPVVFRRGALGNTRDLAVSPAHRMLLEGWRAEVLYGEAEVLAAARDLVNGDTIYRAEGGEVTYYHVMFDDHQIISAEGIPSESFQPGRPALDSVSQDARAELLALFPELATDEGQIAGVRKTLSALEVRAYDG
ncbi:Hint domain-containing protein [Algicella marina]|uniref:Type I secretion protein n=1 Tax=Algicella marina TaxID=2683284 RepID=A0A6P1T1P9_9RHOB|nr:Hint domain-containing protein [Algicella marina]QHQ35730.1 type I secretion protein [Algicella marina]